MNKLLKQAFTLIELLVVIAIIGILSGLIIVGMNGMTQKATIAKAQVFSNSLRNSLMMNIIGEWKFDSITGTVGSALTDGTVVADSWSTNNGTTTGGPTLKSGTDCVSGQCLSFDGSNDYVDCGSRSSFNITDGITIGAWIYKNDWSMGNYIKEVISKYYTAYEVYIRGGKIAFQVNRVSSVRAWWDILLLPGWHYVVFSFDKNNLSSLGQYHSLFVDGQIRPLTWIDGTDTNSILGINNEHIFIGARIGDTSLSADCLIDDIRIYNAAMPTSQIKEQYYSGLNKLLSSGGITKDEYQNKVGGLAVGL